MNLFCILCTLTSLTALAQDLPATVQLVDISGSQQSFISFSGAMDFNETIENGQRFEKQTGKAEGKNISGKSVVAVVVTFAWTGAEVPGGVDTIRHDHFFSSKDFAPGKTIDFPGEDSSVSINPAMKGADPSLTYTVKVGFIQFSDGSTWGDPRIGAELKMQRNDILAFYQSLLSSYNAGDLQTFIATANTPPVSRQHQQLSTAIGEQKRLQMILAGNGVQGAVEFIKQRLAAGAAREAAGNF